MIYVVQQDGRPFIKIGHTARSVETRIREFNTGSVERITVLFVMEGNAAAERRLHKQFSAYRVRDNAEWFRLEGDLQRWVDVEKERNDEQRRTEREEQRQRQVLQREAEEQSQRLRRVAHEQLRFEGGSKGLPEWSWIGSLPLMIPVLGILMSLHALTGCVALAAYLVFGILLCLWNRLRDINWPPKDKIVACMVSVILVTVATVLFINWPQATMGVAGFLVACVLLGVIGGWLLAPSRSSNIALGILCLLAVTLVVLDRMHLL